MMLPIFLALFVIAVTSAHPIPAPNPDPISPSLSPRQTLSPTVAYAPGTFTVPASDTPFFTTPSGTATHTFQTDGNYVIRVQNTQTNTWSVFWASNSAGHSCASGDTGSCTLTFGADGYLRIYIQGNNVWSSGNVYGTGAQYHRAQLKFWPAYLSGSVLQYADITDAAGDIVWATGIVHCAFPYQPVIGC